MFFFTQLFVRKQKKRSEVVVCLVLILESGLKRRGFDSFDFIHQTSGSIWERDIQKKNEKVCFLNYR